MPDFESILGEAPARMTLVSLADGGRVEAMFNPENLEEALTATYAKQKVLGLSHTPKQFSNTEDLTETYQLVISANDGGPTEQSYLLEVRRRLMSWCYPRNATSLVGGAGPSRVLFVWPGFMSLTCVVTSLRFKYPKMSKAGPPLIMTVDVTMEEIRDTLLLSDDVFNLGTERTA